MEKPLKPNHEVSLSRCVLPLPNQQLKYKILKEAPKSTCSLQNMLKYLKTKCRKHNSSEANRSIPKVNDIQEPMQMLKD